MLRHKTLLMACAVVMLCATFNTGSAFGVEITEGQTYDGYTDAGNAAGFYGGVSAVTNGNQAVKNNTFSNNTNTHGDVYGIPGGGGAIHNYNGTITVEDSVFNSNHSTAPNSPAGGGAILLNSTKSAEINNTEFKLNEAAQSGGAIYFTKVKQGNITGSQFIENQANSSGGALYIHRSENIEISDSEFKTNKVGKLSEYNKYGGAIMINGLSISSDSGITYAIHDCIFAGNEANVGGAIFVSGSDLLFNNLTFNDNHANSGGALAVSSSSSFGKGVEIYNSEFTRNTANDSGGAIDVSGSFTVDSSTFTENSANSGGAIIVATGDPVFIKNSTFENNTAQTLGGAVYSHGGTLEIHNSKFENNHALTRGGAVAVLSNSSSTSGLDVVRIINSDFINNKADQHGGAIHVNQNAKSGVLKLFQVVSDDGKTHEFTGNMQKTNEDFGTPESNAIFIEEGKVQLITRNDNSKLLFNDGIAGSSIDKASVSVAGDVTFNAQVENVALTMNSGTVTLNSNNADFGENPFFDNVDLTLNSGDFNMQNGKIEVLNIRNFEMDPEGAIKLAFDADLLNGKSDMFNISQNMQGGMKFDAEHVDVKIKDGKETSFKLFNKLDPAFLVTGDSIVQYTNSTKYTLTLGEEGVINVEKDSTNGLADALNAEGIREYRQNPAKDLTLTQNLGVMGGEYLKINFDNKELNGGGYEGITVGENQRLALNNITLNNFSTENSGAVVNNSGELTITNAIVKNNTSAQNGGAINNTGSVKVEDTSFINNKASGEGGAIYNDGGKVEISAFTKDVKFSGNTQGAGSKPVSNDITMVNNGDKVAELTFNASKTITLNGGIKGEGVVTKNGVGNLVLNGDNSQYTGDVHYNGGTTTLMQGAQYFSAVNTHFNNGARLNLANNSATDKINFGNLHMDGNGKLGIDIDAKTGLSDMIAAETVNGDGKLIVDNINVMFDKNTNITSMKFDFVEKDEKGNSPLLDVVELNLSEKTEVLGPIFRYGANYDPKTGQIILAGSAGKTSKNYNPAVLTAPVGAMAGAYLTQLNSYDMAFNNMEMYMLMPRDQRRALKMRNRYAITTGGVYSQAENKGLWVKPYSAFENVRLNNGPKVSNVSYGSFFGGDSELFELKNGFEGMYSIYGSYNGSHQSFNGNGIYQNGGTLGVTGVVYKGNFFSALTANVGASVAEANTMYGHENFSMLMSGVAAKTGYNWELAEGKFIVQPSYTMSYSFINTFDYKNAAGVSINGDPLNAIQIAPGIRFIGNFKHGWQPYVGLTIVWNLMDDTKFAANNVSLPELSLDPYFLYGIGVQKTIGERCTGFLQSMFRSGGRNGVGFQFGFRIAI